MINSRIEVDLLEASDMLDVSEEVLGKLAEEGKLAVTGQTRQRADLLGRLRCHG